MADAGCSQDCDEGKEPSAIFTPPRPTLVAEDFLRVYNYAKLVFSV